MENTGMVGEKTNIIPFFLVAQMGSRLKELVNILCFAVVSFR
jgi:hypothetical protein